MKTGIIIYESKYGATKKYVDWLVEETGLDCIETKKAKPNDLFKYDTIILGGGIYASGIAGLSFLRKYMNHFSGKNIVVFCVGASPYEDQAFQEIYTHNFKDALSEIPCFYYRGAWDEDAMTFKDRTLCKMLQKAIAKKNPATYEPWQKALMSAIGQKCDWTNKDNLKGLIEYINK